MPLRKSGGDDELRVEHSLAGLKCWKILRDSRAASGYKISYGTSLRGHENMLQSDDLATVTGS